MDLTSSPTKPGSPLLSDRSGEGDGDEEGETLVTMLCVAIALNSFIQDILNWSELDSSPKHLSSSSSGTGGDCRSASKS